MCTAYAPSREARIDDGNIHVAKQRKLLSTFLPVMIGRLDRARMTFGRASRTLCA
jgi:hypothetical protein